MYTLGGRNKFVRNWKSIFVNVIEINNKGRKKKSFTYFIKMIFPCLHKSCSSFLISISWIILICAKFYPCKLFKIWSSAKVNACKMQKFYAWANLQKFYYVKISTFEVGSKESFFVVLWVFFFFDINIIFFDMLKGLSANFTINIKQI